MNYDRKQYFEKKGKRYVPANDPYACEGLHNGAWLIIVKPNCQSIKKVINPEFIKLDAALEYLMDGLCHAMSKAGEIRSRNTKMSKKEIRAWKEFDRIMGKDKLSLFEYASYWEIVNAGREYIKKIMIENKMDIEQIKKNFKPKKIINSILGLET